MPSFNEKKKSSVPQLSMDNNMPPAKNAFTGPMKSYTGNVKSTGGMAKLQSMTKPTITAAKKTAKVQVGNTKGGKKLTQSTTAATIKKPGKKK